MKATVGVNLNNNITAVLTKLGADILKERNKPDYDYSFDRKTMVLKTQLWSFMNTFGPYLWNGCDLPCKSGIEVEVEEDVS